MQLPKNYLLEVQRFTTSQYWNSGIRITSGVMVPLLIMAHQGWLTIGTPFLFGALFVSLTDTPGPIHHRRNGMLVAVVLNTITVFITGIMYHHDALLLLEVIVFSFFFSLLGIYGARAGAIGTLAIVIMLIHMSPLRQELPLGMNALLTAGGGLWYTTFSLLLNRLQPYRLVEQALGENLLLIAEYIRARAAFYDESVDIDETFNSVMQQQVEVLKSQTQLRELLFKTRQFVGDASPKSRSIMMMFLESLDLFEEAMYAYQDYAAMRKNAPAALVTQTRRLILKLAAELEQIGLSIQGGVAVKKKPSLDDVLENYSQEIFAHTIDSFSAPELQIIHAFEQNATNIRGMTRRLQKMVQYSRMEAYDPNRFPDQELEKPPASDPLSFALLVENFTFRANHFRYAVRITVSMIIAFAISAAFELSHAYWVMLTVITILKPVYNLTRARNIQRMVGTVAGVVLGIGIVYVATNTTVLIVIMIACMTMAYSLLRVNYLGFVIFLTTYILITFHFLNPIQFRSLIGERLIDTFIGSVIAALASRFVFPVWQQYNIQPAMKKMMIANTTYFLAAWNALQHPKTHRKQYNAARGEAIVTLTNLSDNFQQMLVEPAPSIHASAVHQFVIANLSLTSRISALSDRDLAAAADAQAWTEKIISNLQLAGEYLEYGAGAASPTRKDTSPSLEPQHTLAIIYSLSKDIKGITKRLTRVNE